MTTEEKGRMISTIMRTLETTARIQKKAFDDGVFFSLAFMADDDLRRIARLAEGAPY